MGGTLGATAHQSAQEPHGEPRSYAEAMQQPEKHAWERAARENMNNHTENSTWSLVPRPENCIVIGSRWVFWLKYNTDSSIEWHKVRLIAKGYNQQLGFEYLEVFAPTIWMPTVRTILALAAIKDWHLQSLDISHVYLNREMDIPVYMEQPKDHAGRLKRDHLPAQ